MEYELYHHGVKGMKWGVRRYQNKDGSLTPAGKARSQKPTSDRDHSKSNKMPLVTMAAKMAMNMDKKDTSVTASNTVRLAQAGKSYVQTAIYNKDREGCKTDSKTGFLMKNKEMTQLQDAARVNPMVHNFDNNTKRNCVLCTAAYDLRRRGYEVRAKKASYGYKPEDIAAWYPKAKINVVKGVNEKGKPSVNNMMTKLKDELVKQGDGARGNLMVKLRGLSGGHSVAYEVSNGKLNIIDAQIGKVYTNPDHFLRRCKADVSYARYDNIEFNTKTIKEVAE